MTRFAFIFILFCASAVSAQKNYVVLISIDGLRPEFYLDPKYPAPNIQRLMREGSYAEHMKSVFPSYTFPAHTSMMTGAFPMRHGIVHNNLPNSKAWYWYAKDIKSKTIWQALKEKNMPTAVVNWPVTANAEINYRIPDIWDTLHPEDHITVARQNATTGLVEEIELNATGKLTAENMKDGQVNQDANWARMAAYIFQTKKPPLLAVHLIGVDGAQHDHGTDHEAVRLALANTDNGVGCILESIARAGLTDSTTVIIVGDHGLTNMHTYIAPNLWIKDLKARFRSAAGSAFLYLNERNDTKTLAEVKKRMNSIDPKYKQWFRIIERPELDRMGADANAALALAAIPGIVFNSSDKGDLSGPSYLGGHHGYDPNYPEMYTGFIASGYGIRKGVIFKELCVVDIAPLIAKLLNIDFNSPDGILYPGLLQK